MPKYILVMKPNGELDASLTEAVATLCVDVEDVVNTVLRYAASDELSEVVDGNLDWDTENGVVREMVEALTEEDDETVFDVGLYQNEEDDNDIIEGLEVYVKLLPD